MKKLLIALLLLATAFSFAPKTYATTTAEENVFSETTWTMGYALGRYYAESDWIKIQWDYFYIEVSKFASSHSSSILEGYQIFEPGTYSRVLIYQTPQSTTPTEVSMIKYEGGLSSSDFLIAYESDDSTPFNFGTYKNMYVKVRLQFTSTLTASQRGFVMYNLNDDDKEVLFDISFLTYNDILSPMTLEDLPVTEGSPMNRDEDMAVEYDKYGTVEFSYIDGDVTLWITYFGFYTYVIPDVVFTDDAFLDNVENVYYYTEDGDRFLYFAYGEYDDFVLTDGSAEAKPWSGFTIWNLTTNEIQVVQRAWSLTYIDVQDLDAYAYFYMPNIPTDDLLSVSLAFKYRIAKKGLTTAFSTTYTDWKTSSLILEKDEESVEHLPQWTIDTIVYGGSAMAMAGALSLVPVVGKPIVMVLLLSGGITASIGGVGALYEVFTDNVDQITKITAPSSLLVSAINDHFTELAGTPVDVTGKTVYKLHLGSFSDVDARYVEFDMSNYKYTEVVWTTNGTVYVANDDILDSQVIVDRDYVAERPEETAPLNLMSMLMLPLITILFIVIGFRTKSFKNLGQFVIVIALFGIVLLVLGVI